MRASGTNISSRQSYSFELHSSQSVSVPLPASRIDFDCRVGSQLGARTVGARRDDDPGAGTLGCKATIRVVVYPYDGGGPGNYSLTVTAIPETITFVAIAQPFGAPDSEDD